MLKSTLLCLTPICFSSLLCDGIRSVLSFRHSSLNSSDEVAFVSLSVPASLSGPPFLQSEPLAVTDVLMSDIDTSYTPRTRDTRIAYESLLSLIQQEMGGQPHDVLRSAADEVLGVLKDDSLKVHNLFSLCSHGGF